MKIHCVWNYVYWSKVSALIISSSGGWNQKWYYIEWIEYYLLWEAIKISTKQKWCDILSISLIMELMDQFDYFSRWLTLRHLHSLIRYVKPLKIKQYQDFPLKWNVEVPGNSILIWETSSEYNLLPKATRLLQLFHIYSIQTTCLTIIGIIISVGYVHQFM